uniref:DUF4236 domain-containing protein n=1 Tax=Steinernema glaseri TaxID=37863 RepID=A0A1I7YMG2_9BILA
MPWFLVRANLRSTMGSKASHPANESGKRSKKGSVITRCLQVLFSRGSNPFAVRRPFSQRAAYLASKH